MDNLVDIPGVVLTPLRVISGETGRIMHVHRDNEPGYCGFGEAYISTVNGGATKGWKRHRRMTLNLVVPVGCIRFHLFDDRGAAAVARWTCIDLGPENFQRLTVPPGIWMAFRGIAPLENWLINIANIVHDPGEADVLPLNSSRFSMIDL